MNSTVQARIKAEVKTPISIIQILHIEQSGSALLQAMDHYCVVMCLTPGAEPLSGRYSKHWGDERNERLGKLFVVPPGENLRVNKSDSRSRSSVICRINSDVVNMGSCIELDWGNESLQATLNIPHRYIQSLINRIVQETLQQAYASEQYLEQMSAHLALELARYFSVAKRPDAYQGALSACRMQLIENRLAEVREPPSLRELADLCHLSVRQLGRSFKSSRNCTLGDSITQRRIDHAKRMILANQNIKAIAHILGYSSPSNFSYAFRKATGLTPLAFRKSAAQEILANQVAAKWNSQRRIERA